MRGQAGGEVGHADRGRALQHQCKMLQRPSEVAAFSFQTDLTDLTLLPVEDLELVVVGVAEELPENRVVEPPDDAIVLM